MAIRGSQPWIAPQGASTGYRLPEASVRNEATSSCSSSA